MMTTRSMLAVVLSATVLSAACDDSARAAATAALDAARGSFEAVKTEAAKYVPEQEEAAEDALKQASNALRRGEYADSLRAAQALLPKVTALAEATTAKKTELTTAWTRLSGGLPGAVTAIQARIDELSKTRRLPATVSKDAVAAATAGLRALKTAWTEAGDMFTRGNLAEAVGKAQTVKAKAAAVMTSLGMTVPDSLK